MDAVEVVTHYSPWLNNNLNTLAKKLKRLYKQSKSDETTFEQNRQEFMYYLKYYEQLMDLTSNYFTNKFLNYDPEGNKVLRAVNKVYEQWNHIINPLKALNKILDNETIFEQFLSQINWDWNGIITLIEEYETEQIIKHHIYEMSDYFINHWPSN